MDFQDDVSTTSTKVSEISTMTDESETEEEMDPWIPLIEEAKQRSNSAISLPMRNMLRILHLTKYSNFDFEICCVGVMYSGE